MSETRLDEDDIVTETGHMQTSDSEAALPASRPWRQAVGALAVVVAIAMLAGAFVLPAALQVRVTQFMIPPYCYVCLGLAVIALVEVEDSRSQRVFMSVALAAVALLNVLCYAVGGVAPLAIVGVQTGLLVSWVAWRRRAGWTLLWLVVTLGWIGVAAVQGRLFR